MAIISIILPVYNTEAYIHRCIKSILGQTFSNYELIIVDDGSPDNCPSICDFYATTDKRIHVIHQKNSGLSAARNTGIDWVFQNSESKWITFIDSDDWVHPMFLETLFNAVSKSNTRISMCQFRQTAEEISINIKTNSNEVLEPEQVYIKEPLPMVAWGKLYYIDCFKNIRYPRNKIHEDEFTTYLLLFNESHISVVREKLYFYYINPSGIINSIWKPNRLDACEALISQIHYFKEHHYELAYKKNDSTL